MKRLAILDDYQGVALRMADWSPLNGAVEITVLREHIADEDALAARLRDCEIVCIMRERTPFPRSLFEKLPKLEHLFTTGMRNRSIDLQAAREQGVVVTGTPTLDHPTPELTWGLMLALARQIPAEDRAMHEGKWAIGVGRGLKGSTLGVIGLGRMGTQVARIGLAFGMKVIAWSPNLTAERCREAGVALAPSKENLLRESDFVTLHVMLGERSRGMIGRREFALMKPTAYLVNTARGPVVDEAALIEALRARRIAGAGIDVYDVEPLPADHALRSLDNAILMPHQGYVAEDNYRIFYEGAVRNIRSWLDGKVVNEVTEATGPKTHRAGQ
jgi:phosphoglycerate dehydrogenase-like enzyme